MNKSKGHPMKQVHPLQNEFRERLQVIGEKVLRFPFENPHVYAGWLAQTYYFVRHTTSLICLVAAQYGPDNREKHYHAIKHLQEERGHDLLLLNDLKKLGFDHRRIPELPETTVFYQTQYYLVEHQGPAALLGYSLFLEGIAAEYGTELHRLMTDAHGPDGAEFMHVHLLADPKHFAEDMAALAKLEPADAEAVGRNLRQSCILYSAILDKVAAEAVSPRLKLAA